VYEVCQNPKVSSLFLCGPVMKIRAHDPVLGDVSMIHTKYVAQDLLCPGPDYGAFAAFRYPMCQSKLPHDEHAEVSDTLMSASLPCVGIRSCIAKYHVDFIASGTGLACRFIQTCFQFVSGNFRTIRKSICVPPFMASLPRTLYTRRLKCLLVSSGAQGPT
jgi:hypothetical protein